MSTVPATSPNGRTRRRRVAARTTVRLRDPELFRRAMVAKGLSVRGLADRTPVSKSMIQHLRDGSLRTCSRRVAECIEDALGVRGLLFEALLSNSDTQSSKSNGRAA